MAKKARTKEAETTAEPVEQTKPEGVTATVKPSTIYIGKTVYGLTYGTIFKNGVLPPFVEELAKKDAAIKGQIVPLTELQAVRDSRKRVRIVVATNKQK